MTRLAVAVAVNTGIPPTYWLEHPAELYTAAAILTKED